MTIKIGLCGATGRMGRMIQERITHFPQLQISATFPQTTESEQTLAKLCANSQIIIDFSTPQISASLLELAVHYNNKLIIGTTGFNSHHLALIKKASKKIVIFCSANMSIGVGLLGSLVGSLAKSLPVDYDIDIIETHHREKKDHPSGTALWLRTIAAEKRNIPVLGDKLVNGTPRSKNTINISSIRSGNIIGDHQIIFTSDNEIISLKHQALDRNLFADGALRAALWINKQSKPALYSINNLLKSI